MLAPLRRAAVALACVAAACSPAPSATGPTDASPTPDLSPLCLPVEPAPPDLPPDCPVAKPAQKDALDDALATLHLDRCSLTLPIGSYDGRTGYRLPFFAAAHDHPVNAPAFGRALTALLDDDATSPTPVARQLAHLGNRLATDPLDVCAPAAPVDAARPLAAALAALVTATGGTPDAAALDDAVATVPMDLQSALAPVVSALATATADWAALTASLSDDDLAALAGTSGLVLPGAGGAGTDVTNSDVRKLLTQRFDLPALVTAAARLSASVESAHLEHFAGAAVPSVDIATPIGRIVLRGPAADTYEDEGDGIALLVDTGGNDTYRKAIGAVGGNQTVEGAPLHLAVALDLGGDDTYGYPEVPSPGDTARDKAMAGVQRLPSDADGRYGRRSPDDNGPISLSDAVRQGGARLGIALLFDLGTGRDHYRALRMSQGFGAAGVGVLYDAGGDDLYEGEAGVQGAALFGVGLLLDAAGSDTYRTYSNSQGFGGSRGAGLLYDAAGNDHYVADTGIPELGGDPIYYSPQAPCKNGAPCGNSSMSQGVGFGRRPGPSDNASMAGGLGVLRDRAGDDVYLAGIFAQGSAYWVATGLLADGAGDDTYDGWWYTQGSCAHGALCVLTDDAGDDHYDVTYEKNPPYSTNTGQGHDFSVGWLVDGGGADRFRGPNLSLGSGNANGGGFLINLGGDDAYSASSPFTLGGAAFDLSAQRAASTPCYGLFLDVGGHDTYAVPADPRLAPAPADDTTWHNPRDDQPYADLTVGVDRATGTVTLP